GVHVAMSVHPEQADRQLLRPARPIGGGRDRSRPQAVIAAEHHRHRTLVQRSERRLIDLLADLRDVADVLLLLVAQLLRLRNRRREVALVDDGVSETNKPFAEPRDAKRGRAHVDAAPAAPQVEGNADDVYGFHDFYLATKTPKH